MPNGRTRFIRLRNALQREPPSCDHTSDEECVQEAKQAWPRPRILALWTMRAWQTFINRSRIVKSLTLHRVIPEAVLAHCEELLWHLAEFLARWGHRVETDECSADETDGEGNQHEL